MVEFRTDVFDAESVEALIGRLERVLSALTADPSRAAVIGGSARRVGTWPVGPLG